MKKMKESTKKNIIRVIMFIAAVMMILSFVLMPLFRAEAAENSSVSVSEFESGRLSDALADAMDGVDRNNISSAAVSGGVLTAADYAALCELPNLEFIELAGAETENGAIPDNALPARNQLTYISLPANTLTIGNGAFTNNKQLKKISMPATVTSIGDYAFDGCIALEDITPPANLESLGEGAFRDCQSLSDFTLPQGVTRIPAWCFAKCPLTEFYIGPQVESIGDGAFSDCHELKDIYIYGDKAPELEGGGVFQNLNVTVHTADDADGYGGWKNNFVSTEDGFNDEYVPPETAAPETGAADDAEPEETSAKVTEAEKQTEGSTETTAAEKPAEDKSGSGSNTVTIVIIVAVIAVLISVGVNVAFMIIRKKQG